MKACSMGWKETGVILVAERRERVRQTETISSSGALDDAFKSGRSGREGPVIPQREPWPSTSAARRPANSGV